MTFSHPCANNKYCLWQPNHMPLKIILRCFFKIGLFCLHTKFQVSQSCPSCFFQGWLKVTYNVEIPTFKYEKIELLVCIYEISRELVFIYGISGCSRCLTPATIVNPIPFHPKFIWDSYSQANWSSKCSPLKWWLIHTYGKWQTVLRLIVHHSQKI